MQVVGDVFFINDDKIITDKIELSDSVSIMELNKYCNSIQELIKQGCIVIQRMKANFKDGEYIKFLDCYDVSVFIPVVVSKKALSWVVSTFHSLALENEVDQVFVTNYRIDLYGLDYDYCIYQIHKDKGDFKKLVIKIGNVINCFVREKIGTLTEEEKKMFSCYRNFQLEELLCNDYSHYLIHHGNAGIISIYKDQVYSANCVKVLHGKEIDRYLEVAGYSLEQESIIGLVERTNSIQIQLSKNVILCWVYDLNYLSNFQLEELDKFFKCLKDMKERDLGNFDIFTIIIWKNGKKDSFDHIDKFSELVSNMVKKKIICK